MTTCRELIRSAMLEIRAIASGETPTTDEESDALTRLKGIVDGLFGYGVGTELTDLEVTATTELTADTRALVFAASPITLSFPESPANGARIQVRDMNNNFATYPVTALAVPSNMTLNTNGTNNTYIYLADTASWTRIAPLALDDELILGDDEYFTLELAGRLCPMFGASLTPESGAALVKAANRIRARFRSQAIIPCDDGVRYLSTQSYRSGLDL